MSPTTEAGPEVVAPGTDTAPASLPAWLLHHAAVRPRAVAIRTKELGRWREITWAEHAAATAALGRGLGRVGVGEGDRVLLLSENRPEWLVTDLAVQGLGAATVALFPTTTAGEVASLAARCAARVAVVEDEEQLDKILETRGTTSIERVFVVDTRGLTTLEAPAASFEELMALGSAEAVEHAGGDLEAWHASVARLRADAVATVVFTPGTTGRPKGALLTHANLRAAAAAGADAFGLVPGDRIVSCLPLCEIVERALVAVHATRAACTVHFGEGGAALELDVREVQPTVFLGVPRLWDRLRARVEVGMRDAGWVKRTAFRAAVHAGRATTPRRCVGGRVRSPVPFVLARVVTRPLRRQLGLGRVRVALAGAAPSEPEQLAWWWAVGVPLREVYGLTESSGIATVPPADDVRLGTVGRPVDGVEVAIDAGGSGEIELRGSVVFAGYLDGDDDAHGVRLVDGWLKTGDAGSIDDDGFLTIVDRMREVIITAGGHDVAPAPIARALESSPYVAHALVVGERRPYVGALLAIDGDAVGDWAATRGVPFTTHRSLAENPDVRDLIAQVIAEVNESLPVPDRVRCFAVLPGELSHDGGALTAIGKLRRGVTAAAFDDVVDAMYASSGGGESA